MLTNLITHPKPVITRYSQLVLWMGIGAVVLLVVAYFFVLNSGTQPTVTTQKPMLATSTEPLVTLPPESVSAPVEPPKEQPYLWRQKSEPTPDAEPQSVPPTRSPGPPSSSTPQNPVAELRSKERQDGYRAPLLVAAFSPEKGQSQESSQSLGHHARRMYPQTLEVTPNMDDSWSESPPILPPGMQSGMPMTREPNNGMSQDHQAQYLNAQLQPPRSPFQVNAGMQLPVVLAQDVTSDVMSFFSAVVTQDVYDSVTSRFLLVPAGSRITFMSDMDDRNTNQQPILLMSAKTLYLPNGYSLPLQGMPAANGFGMTGLRDTVNRHFFQRYGSAAVLSLIVAGVRMATYSNSGGGQNGYSYSPQDAAMNGAGMVMGETVAEDLRQKLNIKPTVVIRAGYPFNVMVTVDMTFTRPYNATPDRRTAR